MQSTKYQDKCCLNSNNSNQCHLKKQYVCQCISQFSLSVSQYVNLYNEESNLCLLAPTHGILSAFLFNFASEKSALCFRLLLLYSANCLNIPYNISTCGLLKSQSVEFKSDRLHLSLFFEKLSINEIEQSTGERLTLL